MTELYGDNIHSQKPDSKTLYSTFKALIHNKSVLINADKELVGQLQRCVKDVHQGEAVTKLCHDIISMPTANENIEITGKHLLDNCQAIKPLIQAEQVPAPNGIFHKAFFYACKQLLEGTLDTYLEKNSEPYKVPFRCHINLSPTLKKLMLVTQIKFIQLMPQTSLPLSKPTRPKISDAYATQRTKLNLLFDNPPEAWWNTIGEDGYHAYHVTHEAQRLLSLRKAFLKEIKSFEKFKEAYTLQQDPIKREILVSIIDSLYTTSIFHKLSVELRNQLIHVYFNFSYPWLQYNRGQSNNFYEAFGGFYIDSTNEEALLSTLIGDTLQQKACALLRILSDAEACLKLTAFIEKTRPATPIELHFEDVFFDGASDGYESDIMGTTTHYQVGVGGLACKEKNAPYMYKKLHRMAIKYFLDALNEPNAEISAQLKERATYFCIAIKIILLAKNGGINQPLLNLDLMDRLHAISLDAADPTHVIGVAHALRLMASKIKDTPNLDKFLSMFIDTISSSNECAPRMGIKIGEQLIGKAYPESEFGKLKEDTLTAVKLAWSDPINELDISAFKRLLESRVKFLKNKDIFPHLKQHERDNNVAIVRGIELPLAVELCAAPCGANDIATAYPKWLPENDAEAGAGAGGAAGGAVDASEPPREAHVLRRAENVSDIDYIPDCSVQ